MSLSLHDLYCVYITASGGDPAGGPGKRMITVGSVAPHIPASLYAPTFAHSWDPESNDKEWSMRPGTQVRKSKTFENHVVMRSFINFLTHVSGTLVASMSGDTSTNHCMNTRLRGCADSAE